MRRQPVFLLALLVLALAPPISAAADEEAVRERGKAIYGSQCASCHGGKGQGTEDYYPDPLAGDMSIGELTDVIADTMPEEDPDACVGKDAAAVAAYIHYAFYSEAAQIRNRPPRVTLARLTADQLRQSLADLYARLDGVPEVTEQRGLEGKYYGEASRRRGPKKDSLKFERIDPVVDFDFAHDGPGGEIDPEEYSIQWSGGLVIDQTGQYEIVVRSTCAFVFDFGAPDRELINNHVQSGDKTEFRRTVFLTAGRVYPIEITFSQRKRKTEQPPGRISLSWVPPHGVEEIIPARHLVAETPPPALALQTALPPDDRSYGYERGIAVNRQWDESTTEAAIEFARYAVEELWPRYQQLHRSEDNDNRQVLRQFLTELVETAFRGPLTDELRDRYIDRQVDAEQDDTEAIKRVLLISLKSPRFLYPTLDALASPSRRVANRLALILFDSLPADRWLLEAAEKGQLTEPEQIRRAATRMVNDYRARGKMRKMVYQWLDLGHLGEINKDDEKFPGFTEELVSDLRQSFDATVDHIVWEGSGDYRQFFQADWAYTTERIAEFYGAAWEPADEDGPRMRRSVEAPEARFGILNHPLLMSGLAYHAEPSPIHRGVFLIRYVLGRSLRPPNEAFTPLSPDLHPDLTNRERVALQTSPESCQVCHSKINSLGFTLENFDAVGRYRSQDRGQPIDASGSYLSRTDELVEFAGPSELADYLASSDDAHRAFVGQAFEFFVKQPIAAYGPDRLDQLTESFRDHGFNIRHLLIEIAVIAASHPLEEDT